MAACWILAPPRPLESDGLTAPVGDSMVYTTSGYTAPELWDLQGGALRLSPATDLYSAGRLLHRMLTGKIYTGRDEQTFYLAPYCRRILKAVQCPPEALAVINQLLQRLLHNDPAKRYQSAEELLYSKDFPSVEAVLNLLRPAKNQLGLDLSTLGEDEFVGRADECRQIDNLLKNRRKPVILWGFGGMGKTELAIEYASRYQQNGRGKVFFVRFAGSFRDTLIGPVADAFSGYSKVDPATRKPKPQEQILREVLQMLGEYGRDDLLIIDNVDHTDQDFDHLTAESSYKKLLGLPIRLVLTTRTEQEGQIQVGPLNQEELRTIMRRFYAAPDEVLDALIDAVNGHTLAVELMARMLKADRRMTADTLLERLNTVGGLNREKDVRISSQKDRTRAGFGEKERIYEHLRILFDCSGLDDSEQLLLRHGFLIPDMGMDSALFLDCEPEDAAESLDKLISLGWLQESRGETRTLTMHPLVREIVWGELKPDGENCEEFLDALENQYDSNEAHSSRNLEQAAETLMRTVQVLPIKPEKETIFLDQSGRLFSELGADANNTGNYRKGLEFYQKSLSIHEMLLPTNHPNLAKDYQKVGMAWGKLGYHNIELEFLQKALTIQKNTAMPHHLDQASVYNNIGSAWGELGDQYKKLVFYQKALAIWKKVLPPDHPILATSYNNVGSAWGKLGDHHKQLEFYQKGLAILEKVLPPDHPDLATCYSNVGYTWGQLGNHHKRLEFYQKALAIQEKMLPPDHPDLAASYNNVGLTWGNLGDHYKELEFFQKALAILEKVLPPNHPDLATSYNNVGSAWGDLGDHHKDLEFKQKALAIREKVLPPDHPLLAASYNNVGLTWGQLGDHRKELEFLQKALAIREKVLPPDHPLLATSYNNIGYVWGQLGDHRKELEFLQKALAIREKVLPPDHPDLAASYNNVGLTWGELGDHHKELAFYQKALAIREKVLPADSPQLATTYNNIACAFSDLENLAAALEWHLKALAIREKVLPFGDPKRIKTLRRIAQVYGKIGDSEKQVEYSRRADSEEQDAPS